MDEVEKETNGGFCSYAIFNMLVEEEMSGLFTSYICTIFRFSIHSMYPHILHQPIMTDVNETQVPFIKKTQKP